MCVLCALHRLSQVVPAMLPWLVVPLLALWAASQLLPPPLRFEVTAPRLACGLFLVAVLLWYHVLMPQLLTWQARRSARMQERRRFLAVELQRLRRAAIRRCRNCLTEYRDQNPPGGRFMCCYCGHVSKRPVFDLPGSSGIIHELIGKDNWTCPREWMGGWADSMPPSENSFARRPLLLIFSSMRWLCGKISMISGARGDGSSEKGRSSCKEESRGDSVESKWEKARRKAEEKRQARLERELQEEEERKQREEVFKLIEEQRKLRDEKLEAVKEALRSSAFDGGRDGRKDSGKKRNDRRKEKDWGSSKSNSDVEDLEKKINREGERKCELEKKIESEQQGRKKLFFEKSKKTQTPGTPPQGVRGTMNKSWYFGRFRGSFSPHCNSAGKGAQNTTATSLKTSKSVGGSVGSTRLMVDSHSSGKAPGHLSSNGNKGSPVANQRPVIADQPPPNVWKNRTHWLFKNSLAVSPSLSSVLTPIAPPRGQIPQTSDRQSPRNGMPIVQTLPFSSHPYIDCPVGSDLASLVSQMSECLPSVEETFHSTRSEEGELFEDPCYVPDPVELLGPVSESLDNFPMDVGSGFLTHTNAMVSNPLTNGSIFDGIGVVNASSPTFHKSPMDMPMTTHAAGMNLPSTLLTDESAIPQVEGNIKSQPSIWQMWGSSARRGSLDIIGGSSSWLLPIKEDESEQKVVMHPSRDHTSLSTLKGRSHSGINYPLLNHASMPENGDSFPALDTCLTDTAIWIQKSVYEPLSSDTGKNIPQLKHLGNADECNVSYDSPSRSPFDLSFELSGSKGLEAWGIQKENN